MKVIERNIALEQEFHTYYYHSLDWRNEIKYFDIPILQNPLDLWALQNILFKTKPEIIIEVGRAWGGLTIWLADALRVLIQKDLNLKWFTVVPQIVSIDNKSNTYVPKDWVFTSDNLITYLDDNSLNDDIIESVRSFCTGVERIMVILDSNHKKEHVLQELAAYSQFVTFGNYLVVCDTNASTVIEDFGAGPKEAMDEFLVSNQNFKLDLSRDKFCGLTFNSYLVKT